MEIKDVIALANAGFTKDQIAKIATSINAPAPAPAPVPAPAPASSGVDDILKELGIIKDTMQANALLGAQQPKPETTDDILASIINPPEIK